MSIEERPKRRTGGRPTKEDVERRNIRVMEVATNLFIEKGFAETTLDDIAKRANVAKRTLYNDYQDKGRIFAAVVRGRVAAAITPQLKLEANQMPVEEALLQLASDLVKVCTAPETVELSRLMIAEAGRFPDLAIEITTEGILDLHSNIATILERLARSGHLVLTDGPTRAAVRFCDMVVGMSALHHTLGVNLTLPDKQELQLRVRMFIAQDKAAADAR